jgi:putative endonuclease
MMTNKSRVVLYTGITNSLEVRVWQHRNHTRDGFTKKYHVDRLVYYESFDDPSDAISREKEIKGWRRSKKNALVETLNPKWADLSTMLYHTCEVPRFARDDTPERSPNKVILSEVKDLTNQ